MKPKLHLLTILTLLMSLSAFTARAFEVGDLAYELYTPSNVGTTMAKVVGLSAEGKTKNSNGTLGAITIPSGVLYNSNGYRVYSIAQSAFASSNITAVTINYGVYEIEAGAFRNCTKISYAKFASSVYNIGEGAFGGCSSLKNVTWCAFQFPGVIYSNAFPTNSGMTLKINHEQTKTIDEFKSNTAWKMFSTVTYDNAEASDATFTKESMSYGLTIGSPDKEGYGTERNATVTNLNSSSGSITGRTASSTSGADSNYLGVIYKWTNIGKYAVPANNTITTIDLSAATNLTTIKSYAFYNNTALTKLTLPKSLLSFYLSSVYGCTSFTTYEVDGDNPNHSTYDGCLYNKSQSTLYSVPQGKSGQMYFPSALKTVHEWALYNCTKITTAYLPYGVTTVEAGAFYGASSMIAVKIPSSVTSLSTDRVFYGVKSNCLIYCNMAVPPTVTASSYFGTTSDMALFIPYNKLAAYKNAGWSGFGNYNLNGAQAYDIATSNYFYTVTSSAATTINGKTYSGGRAKLVAGRYTIDNSQTKIEIPASFTSNGKEYAVTMIGEGAFYNHTSNFIVSGCNLVDTVGSEAFRDQAVAVYPFTHNLKDIESYAFSGANLTGTVQIPYGVKCLGHYAFAYGKYSRIVIPSTTTTHYGDFCVYTSTLKEIVYNLPNNYNYGGWNLTDVPNDCYIRVPMGYVDHYKKGILKNRANYITGGAYDFAYSNDYEGRYYISILSDTPVTFDGTTYAGKAKYVYHPNVSSINTTSYYGWSKSESDKTVSSDIRSYLITELGDSLLAGVSKYSVPKVMPASITRIGHHAFYYTYGVNVENLTLPNGLLYIGENAFDLCNVTGEIKIPSTVSYIGASAFRNTKLKSIYFAGAKPTTLSIGAWGAEDNITVWVPYNVATAYYDTAKGWGWNDAYSNKLAVWFKPSAPTQMFSTALETYMLLADIDAYYVPSVNKNNPEVQAQLGRVYRAPAGAGLLLTNLDTDKEYRIPRATENISTLNDNHLVGTPNSSVNIKNREVGFYWDNSDPSNPHFVRPSSYVASQLGGAYLLLTPTEAGNLTEIYTNLWPKKNSGLRGDIDGSGIVDVDDVNLLINIILGLQSAAEYMSVGDLDGNSIIDVDDVNAVLNIILGA